MRLLESSTDVQSRGEIAEPRDLYEWGAALSTITDRLDAAVSVVAGQLGQLKGEPELRDDAGGNPWQRLGHAQEQLEALRLSLNASNKAAREFHSAVSHVGRAFKRP